MHRATRAAAISALAFGLAWGGAAGAQSIDDPEAVTVDELVVQGREPGPAWWRVSDGDTTVYVLGVPAALPKGLRWNTATLKRRLQGANTVVTPPEIRYSANLTDIPGLISDINKAKRANKGQAIPADLAAPLVEAAARAGRKPERYAAMQTWLAGVTLVDDYRNRDGLADEEPERTIKRLVRAARLKPKPATILNRKAREDVRTLLRDTPEPLARECLEGAIAEVRGGGDALRRAGLAWAEGDVKGALIAPRGSERCLLAVPGAAETVRGNLQAQADAVEAALRTPGHAVAILPLRAVIAEEGVLQRLKAKGYVVRAPGQR